MVFLDVKLERITKPAGDFAGGQNSYIFLLFRTGFLALMFLIQQHSDFFPEKLASLGLWLSPLLKLLPNGMRFFFFLSTESNGAFFAIYLALALPRSFDLDSYFNGVFYPA